MAKKVVKKKAIKEKLCGCGHSPCIPSEHVMRDQLAKRALVAGSHEVAASAKGLAELRPAHFQSQEPQ